jgi:hypothetical protein
MKPNVSSEKVVMANIKMLSWHLPDEIKKITGQVLISTIFNIQLQNFPWR